MNDLLLHPKTRSVLEQIARGSAHAVLIVGEAGAGTHAVASGLATQLLGVPAYSAPYFLEITADGKAIGIEQIREAQKFTQLKTTGTSTIRRVIVIDDADLMTTEAQNALLKILEEPPADTVIILTAHRPQQLKPTIHSRVQTIAVNTPSKEDTLAYFEDKGFMHTEIEKSLIISNGQVALMAALLENADGHALAGHIATAKQLYGQSAFERLARVDEIAKQKDDLPNLLYACKRICMSALEQAATKQQQAVIQTWHRQLKLILDAEASLKSNPNTKLLLTNLFIHM